MSHQYDMPEELHARLMEWLRSVDGVCLMSVMARGDLDSRPILMTMHNAAGVLVSDLHMQADHMARNAHKCIAAASPRHDDHEYN